MLRAIRTAMRPLQAELNQCTMSEVYVGGMAVGGSMAAAFTGYTCVQDDPHTDWPVKAVVYSLSPIAGAGLGYGAAFLAPVALVGLAVTGCVASGAKFYESYK